jgi:hypothetical protein
MFLCGPHDKLVAVCSDMKVAAQVLANMNIDDAHLRIEKRECEGAEIGKSIFVLLKHPEPNAPMLGNTQIEKLQTTQFSKDECTSKCDMAYSLEAVGHILK